MRLTDLEKQAIQETVYAMDIDAQIWLFGSRADDHKKGGDIDLLIFSERLLQEDALSIKQKLWDRIGDQKIDLLIARDRSDPFVRVAMKESVRL